MAEVILYTTKICPYCVRAKMLLEKKNAKYKEIDISNDNDEREKMLKKTGGRTSVPQIFIGDKHIGGSDDLYDLDKKGQLDKLLAG